MPESPTTHPAAQTPAFSSIDEIIADIRDGKMVNVHHVDARSLDDGLDDANDGPHNKSRVNAGAMLCIALLYGTMEKKRLPLRMPVERNCIIFTPHSSGQSATDTELSVAKMAFLTHSPKPGSELTFAKIKSYSSSNALRPTTIFISS